MSVRVLRLVVLLAAMVVSAASGGGTATSRPMPPPQQGGQPQWNGIPGAPVASLEGQGFSGTDGNDRINFYFRKGGVLNYRDPAGWWEDGRWQQSGAQVSFSLSNGFASYTGTLQGEWLQGKAQNRNGKSWKFTVHHGTPLLPAALDLTGSSWGGKEDKSCIVFTFRPGGVLEYDTPSGHYTDGKWQVDGDWVYFKHEKSGFQYFGSVKGEHMNGNLWSLSGGRWGWDVNKGVAPPECKTGGTSVASGGKGGFGSDGNVKAPAPAPAIASIEGSTWEGDNGGDATTLKFRPGGVLLAKDPEGDWKGTWFQNGAKVSFDLNGRYSWYDGILDGNSLSGAGHNKENLEWKFHMTRR